jgi:hypothetical protein
MEYMDRVLTCLQCGGRFKFSVSEQEFFSRRGRKNEPNRCPNCRGVRNEWRRGSPLDASIQALIRSGKYRVRQSVIGPEGRPIWGDSK